MNINMNSVNTNFRSKYQVNANEFLADNNKKCKERDFILGVWQAQAKNSEQLYKESHDFFFGEYKKNPQADLIQVYDLDDKYDEDFEKSMKAVGQSFNKLV